MFKLFYQWIRFVGVVVVALLQNSNEIHCTIFETSQMNGAGKMNEETPLAQILPPLNVPTHIRFHCVYGQCVSHYAVTGALSATNSAPNHHTLPLSCFISSAHSIFFCSSYLKWQWQICKWNNLKSKCREGWLKRNHHFATLFKQQQK